jgi:hypothetical protein
MLFGSSHCEISYVSLMAALSSVSSLNMKKACIKAVQRAGKDRQESGAFKETPLPVRETGSTDGIL